MKSHITEDQLIQWLFDLAEPVEASAIADHVARCEACSVLKRQVEQKFAQLDVLEGDPLVSEALIQKTESCCVAGPVRRFPLWWMSLAACLALAGLITVKTIPWSETTGPQVREAVQGKGTVNSLAVPNRERPDAPTAMKAAPMIAMDSVPTEPVQEVDPFAKVPFAPASAIELVTLPRRDHVQVTIYNEEDLTLVRERRQLTLKRGWNWLQFMWANTKIAMVTRPSSVR